MPVKKTQAVIEAFPGIPNLMAGDSNVWFPDLVENRLPWAADRLCMEHIQHLLNVFGLVVCNPSNAPAPLTRLSCERPVEVRRTVRSVVASVMG